MAPLPFFGLVPEHVPQPSHALSLSLDQEIMLVGERLERQGFSRGAAVDAGCSARDEERSEMTSCASSFTAPLWRAPDWAFCCFSSQRE